MKTRAATGSAGSNRQYVSNKGTLPDFVFCGYVQNTHASKNTHFPCDYVRFAVKPDGKHTDPDEPPVIFAVTVPHSCGVELEIGDAVIIRGHVASWKKEDNVYGKWYRLELVADSVKEWDGLFKRERTAAGAAVQPFEKVDGKLYPPGQAPHKKAEKEPEQVDFAEYEEEVIGAEEPLPF